MTDRVYPSTKPKPKPKPKPNTKTTTAATAATTTAATPNRRLPPPPNKTTQFHNPTTNRHPHRPNPTTSRRRRRRRSYLCLCCFWSILITILLLLITAIAGCILYLLYHPHPPAFSISSLKLSQFNLSTTAADDITHLTSKLNLTISTKNPNKKKITFYYNSITITCLSHQTLIAKGSYPIPITSNPNNITIIHSSLHSTSLLLEAETVNKLRSDMRKKSGLPLILVLDTEARVKIETLRTKKVGIRIKCEGIHTLIPKGGGGGGNSSVAATVTAAKCKVDLRIKIWKWTF